MFLLLLLFVQFFIVYGSTASSTNQQLKVTKLAKFEHLGFEHGSLKTVVDLTATTISKQGSLRGFIVVIQSENLTVSVLQEILDPSRSLSGLLLVLPGPNSELSPVRTVEWREVESFLLKNAWNLPIYFVQESNQVREFINSLETGIGGDTYELVYKPSEPVAVPEESLVNIEAWLTVPSPDPQTKTIVLVAHYDSFAAASSWAFGADSNGSGAVALLELLRLFSQLYKSEETVGAFNLLFVWTAAGRFDYAGSKHFIASLDSEFLTNVEFVVCLDSLALGDGLFVHSAKSKDPAALALYDKMISVATDLAVPLQIVHKKINPSQNASWEHEHFAKKFLVSFTVSRFASFVLAGSHLDRSAVLDFGERVDPCVVYRNTRFLAEFLGAVVFPTDQHSSQRLLFDDDQAQCLLDDSTNRRLSMDASIATAASQDQPSLPHSSVSLAFLTTWLTEFASVSRPFPQLTESHFFVQQLYSIIQTYTEEHYLRTFDIPWTSFKLFTPLEGDMDVYQVKPITFDLLVSAIVAAYLFIFQFTLKKTVK